MNRFHDYLSVVHLLQLQDDFQRREFKQLIGPPLGCARDNIHLQHFVPNLIVFQKSTGASVKIISCNERATRILRKGLTFEEFLSQMCNFINRETAANNICKSMNTFPLLPPSTSAEDNIISEDSEKRFRSVWNSLLNLSQKT